MLLFAGILLLIITILIYWMIPFSPYKKSFDHHMKKRLLHKQVEGERCNREEMNHLPRLIRQYCDFIELEGAVKYQAVNAKFQDVIFVFNDKTETVLSMGYDLWLFAHQLFRSAYCTSSLYGVPFDGLDYCKDSKVGGMKGIVGKAIKIFDISNEQMYVAGLISWLAEGAALNPSILLSPYITYEELNETQVKATVSYNGLSGSGVFTFAEDGRILKFESDERQVEKVNGVMMSIGWRAEYDQYEYFKEVKIPHSMKAIKVYPEKEVVYFDAKIAELLCYE